MPDSHYPSIDTSALEEMIMASPKVIPDSRVKVGDTSSFVIKGNQAMHKRVILIRELDTGQICLEVASGLAIRLGFIPQLMEWMEANREWKDGAYRVAAQS